MIIPEKVSNNDVEYTVVEVGESAFRDNYIGILVLPQTITKISDEAFYNCYDALYDWMTKTYSGYQFSVYIKSYNLNLAKSAFNRNKTYHQYVYGTQTLFDNMGVNTDSGFYYLMNPFNLTVDPDYFSLKVKVEDTFTPPNLFSEDEVTVTGLIIESSDYSLVQHNAVITEVESGNFIVSNLCAGEQYDIKLIWAYKDQPEIQNYSLSRWHRTTSLPIEVDVVTTQSTATVSNIRITDTDVPQPQEIWVSIDDNSAEYKDKPVCLGNLNPGYPYRLKMNLTFKEGIARHNIDVNTLPVDLIFNENVGPTSVQADVDIDAGDAKISNTYWNAEKNSGSELLLTGLDPQTEYSQKFVIVYENGYKETKKLDVKTLPLELKTLKPTGVSESATIASAQTNISEYETTAGFQWKKYDAPESLTPSEGYGAVNNGLLEGYIKNLQSTSYYNVRAFYKSAQGKYYYGDWVTFDPSDFSFMEPKVETYDAEDITATSATLRGYVLQGTDDILSQGFEYYAEDDHANARRVAAEVSTENNTILAGGQSMTAQLSDLYPSLTYYCRAFATTERGTQYGELITFTTQRFTSIDSVCADCDTTREVVGYFDMLGHKHNIPQQGLNIVLYSDGSVKKMILK